MNTLGYYETNAPPLRFFHKESTDVAPLRFKSAMCLSNFFLCKTTLQCGCGINIEILNFLGVNDKVREVEGAEKQAMVAVRELT